MTEPARKIQYFAKTKTERTYELCQWIGIVIDAVACVAHLTRVALVAVNLVVVLTFGACFNGPAPVLMVHVTQHNKR